MRTLLLMLLAGAPLAAAQSLTESIEVRVLEIEAVVLDKRGQPVDGLKPSDFEVRVDGRGAEVSNFFAVKRNRVVEEERAGSAPDLPPTTAIPTSLVIFIDDTRLRPNSKKRALEALESYVRANVGPLTSAMLVNWNRALRIRVRPTEKPGYLLTELERMATEPALMFTVDTDRRMLLQAIDTLLANNEDRNLAADQHEEVWLELEKYCEKEGKAVDATLEALTETVRLAAGFAGRKVLLYVGENLPQQPGADMYDYWTRALTKSVDFNAIYNRKGMGGSNWMRHDRAAGFQRVSKEAQRANVTVFGFDPAGARGYEGTGAEHATTKHSIDTTLARETALGGPRLLADETGGRFLANRNNLGEALAAISEQFSTYYSLGVKPPKRTRRGDVVVRVKNRPELRVVSARRRIPVSFEEQIAQNVRSRLYTRTAQNPLAAQLAVGSLTSVDGRCAVPLQMTVPREKIASAPGYPAVGVHFALLDSHNLESDVRSAVAPAGDGPLTHAVTIRVKPREKYVLSVAMVDQISHETTYLQQEIDATACH